MRNQVIRRLSGLSLEISVVQAELSRLRDRLAQQRSVVEDCHLRMLIAETPLAEGDLRTASSSYGAIHDQVRRTERVLALLRSEQAHLGARAAAGRWGTANA